MRYALVKDGQVVNVILWDGETPFDADSTPVLIPDELAVGPGWSYDGTSWTAPAVEEVPPPTEDPAVVQAKQDALTALVAAGVPESVARTIVGLPESD
jgi:hypothetical protein